MLATSPAGRPITPSRSGARAAWTSRPDDMPAGMIAVTWLVDDCISVNRNDCFQCSTQSESTPTLSLGSPLANQRVGRLASHGHGAARPKSESSLPSRPAPPVTLDIILHILNTKKGYVHSSKFAYSVAYSFAYFAYSVAYSSSAY
jgi:hypothetical protein